MLLKYGLEGPERYLIEACLADNTNNAQAALDSGKISDSQLSFAKFVAEQRESKKVLELLSDKNIAAFEVESVSAEDLKKYVGNYASEKMKASVTAEEERLIITFQTGYKLRVKPLSKGEFASRRTYATFEFDGDETKQLVVKLNGAVTTLAKTKETSPTKPNVAANEKKEASSPSTSAEPKFEPSSPESLAKEKALASANWPGFRGNGSRGIAEGQNPPLQWDVEKDENVAWKTPIPGLGNSCPTISTCAK